MAELASTLKFSQFLIEIEDPDNPGTYAAPCGMNSRNRSRTAAVNETNVPKCAPDEDEPSWLERDTVSLSEQITFAGVVADEDFDTWDEWFLSGASRNCRVTMGTRVWLGAYKLTSLGNAGQRGQRVTFDATIMSDGEITRSV